MKEIRKDKVPLFIMDFVYMGANMFAAQETIVIFFLFFFFVDQ